MEVVTGGNSRLDRSWWMVAAGILIFLPPPMCLAAVCNDGVGVMSCPMNELAGVNCSYVKGVPERGDPNRKWNEYPPTVKELRVEPFLQKLKDNTCGMFLNISWKVGANGAAYYKGFFLTVTYVDKVEYKINRTYSLSVADWSNDAIPKTAFRHECIRPITNVLYRVKVHSLPLSPTGVPAMEDKRFPGINAVENSLCVGGSLDPFMSGRWSPTMWANLIPAEDGSVSVEVCFFMAPKEFNFTGYRLVLLNSSDTAFTFIGSRQDENDSIADNGDQQSRRACRKFERVCSGTYKAMLLPVPSEECYYGEGNKQRCSTVNFQPIVVNSSLCSSQTKTNLPSDTTSQPDQSLMTEHFMHSKAQEDDGSTLKIASLTCGIVAAITLVVAVIVAVFRRRKNRHDKGTGEPDESQESPNVDPRPLERQPVLLIYSTDNESHRKVVRSFAAYLNACCGCDVIYDVWSQVEIAQTSPIEWLSKRMYNVRHVIIVNSLGAHLQHSGWIERKSYHPSTNLLLPDVFIPAIRQVQNKMFSKNSRFHCFHVCFPYTELKHVLDLSYGKCYRLMDHIEDLFLNVHGLTKFSAKGTMSAKHINAADYSSSKEGMSLRTAIEEAVTFARENPDWFHRYYRRDESGPTDRELVIYDVYQPSNRPDEETGSFENRQQLQDESGTGSIGTAADMEYYPPSLNGDSCSGCSVDLGGGVHGASPDEGIGRMEGRDPGTTTIDAASLLPLFAQFSPVCPDDLEDDVSSIGSRSFIAKVRELNDQYDSGYYPSIQDSKMFTIPGHC